MRRWILLLITLLLMPSAAGAANCTTCIAGETWQEFGVTSFPGTGAFEGQWWMNPYSVGSGSISTVNISNAPWKPIAGGLTQQYLHMVPGSCSAPNQCTGAYIDLKSQHRYFDVVFYFKTETFPFNGSFGGESFFFRFNNNNYNPQSTWVGTDFDDAFFDNSGCMHWFGGSASSGCVTDTNWHIIEACVDLGTSGTNAKYYVHLDGTLVNSATGVSTGSGTTSTNNLNLDNEYSGGIAFDFGPVLIADPGGCSSSTTITDGVHFYGGHYVPLNNVSVQFTPSTGTNWSNANSTPAGANNNHDATQGQSDLYGISVGTISGSNVLAQFSSAQVQIDGVGDRVGLPIAKISGSTVNGTISNQQAGYLTYEYMNSVITGTTIPTAIGLTVNN